MPDNVQTMNRTDRLYAIVEELRARAPRQLQAGDLAERFEVSGRTIERDILALQEAGVPIWSQRGPGGGYALDPRRTLPPLNLTAEEAVALATALAAAGPMPFADAARSARMKLAAVMATVEAAQAEALAERIRIAPKQAISAKLIKTVQDAVVRRVVVQLSYEDREGNDTERAVEAHGLFASWSNWYLIGWCRMRDGGRVFRLDRIREAALTEESIPERDVDALLDVSFPVLVPSLVE
jgi:predicted DNA-binding transcriptional regulator YafY